MVGIDFICSTSAIDDICTNARLLHLKKLSTTYDLNPDIQKKFFDAIKDILLKAPPPKRQVEYKQLKHVVLFTEYCI